LEGLPMPVNRATTLRSLRLAIEYKDRLRDTVPEAAPWTAIVNGVVRLGWYHLSTSQVARLRGVGITEDDSKYADLADIIDAVQAL